MCLTLFASFRIRAATAHLAQLKCKWTDPWKSDDEYTVLALFESNEKTLRVAFLLKTRPLQFYLFAFRVLHADALKLLTDANLN